MYDHILVALDGSEPSRFAGQTALVLADAMDARLTACHVYGAQMHRRRFSDMEPGLPAKYQDQETRRDLRAAHDRLMEEGFRALSTGYVEEFVSTSRHAGVAVDSAAVEGRSYVEILRLARMHRADLIVLGADGLGALGDGMLGGTTSRVLANAPCDVLIARRQMADGPILTGVDGSEEALRAAARAVTLGQAINRPVHITAVYDPQFHTRVFVTMAKSLSAQRQEEVGLANQEQLHDDIINDGLGKLYLGFLREAEHRFDGNGALIKTTLVTGKAYHALNQQAQRLGADLVVLGRYGHHRESCSHIGSNAENLIRSATTNVLLVGAVSKADAESCVAESAQSVCEKPVDLHSMNGRVASSRAQPLAMAPPHGHKTIAKRARSAAPRRGLTTPPGGCTASQTPAQAENDRPSVTAHPLVWAADAEARLQRVPSFVRSMARRAVEDAVREAGRDCVSAEDFDAVATRFGMGRRGDDV